MEQLQIELITKSIARIVKENSPRTIITNEDIKNGANSPDVIRARQQYADRSGNCYYIEGNFRMTAEDIKNNVELFMKEHAGVKPVVIVDYLQLIAPPLPPFRGGVREAIDENLKTLKDMQKRNELFVIVISSFNRSSNLEPLSYESFKETSMIEFTCDYVWGLQLTVLDSNNSAFWDLLPNSRDEGGRRAQRRRMIEDAQRATPKKVEFVSLKSRNGKQRYEAFFDYYPMHDQYLEVNRLDYNRVHAENEEHIKL